MSIRDALLEWRRKFQRGERMKAEDIDELLAMVPEKPAQAQEAVTAPAVVVPESIRKPAKATKK
jgi:hypothetical protein